MNFEKYRLQKFTTSKVIRFVLILHLVSFCLNSTQRRMKVVSHDRKIMSELQLSVHYSSSVGLRYLDIDYDNPNLHKLSPKMFLLFH